MLIFHKMLHLILQALLINSRSGVVILLILGLITSFQYWIFDCIKLLSANPTKWWNNLKQWVGSWWRIVWVGFTIFLGLALKEQWPSNGLVSNGLVVKACWPMAYWPSLRSNGLMVRVLDSQSRGPMLKTTGWLQSWLNLSSFWNQSNEYQEFLGN